MKPEALLAAIVGVLVLHLPHPLFWMLGAVALMVAGGEQPHGRRAR